jgi:hypothetical protein
MLTNDDIQWIKANRSELTAGRTESVTLVRISASGVDPYTNEPITSETREIVPAVWKEVSTIANSDRSVVNGVELRQDDVLVTFDSDVDLTGVTAIERNGVKFSLVTVDEKGIGTVNRYECVVRRVI